MIMDSLLICRLFFFFEPLAGFILLKVILPKLTGFKLNLSQGGFFMKGLTNVLIRFIIPLAVFFVLFIYLGTLGILIGVILFLGFIAYLNRALILQNIAGKRYQKGDFDGALRDLDRAVTLSPGQTRVRAVYAYMLLKLGHTEKAAEQIKKANELCKIESERNTTKVTQALIFWKQNETDKAIALLEELIKTYQTTNVYGTLGFLYIEKGDYEKALSFNLEAYDYNNTNTIIVDNLGLSYYLNHEYDKALETYKSLMKLKPTFPEAFYNYARVLEHFGEFEEALYMCRNAQSLKFWNISTITREMVDEAVQRLEVKADEVAQKRREERLAALRSEEQNSNDQ